MTSLKKLYELFLKSGKISTDSRKIEKGTLFFALKGENFNGNKYAEDALKKGAEYAIIDEAEYAVNERLLLVEDVLSCLQQLANYHRRQLKIPILGITGTNGKTTTKELISTVLSEKYKVTYTQGNLNNHIGVPLTLLQMNDDTEFGVIEMGANHPGEIATLCQIADPDYGIITNIGKAHLEGFGSFEGVIKTKGELYDYIKEKSGIIFYNHDNQILEELGEKTPNRVSYGGKNADLTGETIQSPPYIHAKVNFPKGVLYINSKLIGDYNFENILAAACIGYYFKIDPLNIQKAIKNYQPNNNRSQLIVRGNIKIIMDAYNANPTSMSASVKSFSKTKDANSYLILGDMLELGEYSEHEHEQILNLVKEEGFKNVLLVGKEFSKSAQKFNFPAFINVEDLCEYLKAQGIKNGNILIKGSRGIQLEKILEIIS